MADGQVTFQISVDAKDAKKSIDDIIKDFEKAGVKVDKIADDMGKSASEGAENMSKAFGQAFNMERVKNFAINAAKQLVQFGKEAVEAASNLAEVQNVVDVTFGSDAGAIDVWAKNAGKQFGLTETQAKQFTSTLGAMMKSAGLTGSQITKMSTDMAGLAADMASFYNLDFDTAFQKIRSGISGETEPLKQLGINLSAANLEAFRLEQGLTKSYSAMSQSEQVVLRYQYLMQATADAQGDFARTSDGYANSMRMLETNIESLKTNVGSAILPVINNVVAGLNSMFDAMSGDLPSETVLDKFAAIDLKTAEKIAEIEQTAAKAQATADILAKLSGTTYTADSLTEFVTSFSGAIDGLGTAMAKAKTGDYAGTMSAITDALEVKTGTSADEWTKLFSAVGAAIKGADIDPKPVEDSMGKVEAALNVAPAQPTPTEKAIAQIQSVADAGIDASALDASMTNLGNTVVKAPPSTSGTVIDVIEGIPGKLESAAQSIDSNGETFTNYLEVAAQAANSLGPNQAQNWQTLVGLLGAENVETMLASWKEAGTATDNMKALFNAIGGFEGDPAALGTLIQNLSEMGINVGDKAEAVALFANSLDQLKETIPGLGEVISGQTGSFETSMQAIYDYIEAWEEVEKLKAHKQGLQEKKDAYESDTSVFEADQKVLEAQAKVRLAENEFNKFMLDYEDTLFSATTKQTRADMWGGKANLTEAEQAALKLAEAYLNLSKAEGEATDAANAYAEAGNVLEAQEDILGEKFDAAAEKAGKFSEAAETAISTAVTAMAPAAEQMVAMWESTRASIADSVGKMFEGFDFKMPELGKDAPTAEGMTKSLQDQVTYMQQYVEMLEQLKENGASSEVLSNLSSGSEEDFAYLKALADATPEQIATINQAYADAQAKREEFINSLTTTTLEGDDTFTQLATQVETGTAAIQTALESANLAGAADAQLSDLLSTVQSYSTSIGSAIDALLANVKKLEGAGLNGWSGGGSGVSTGNGTPHATGLDYVPFNGYHARLHEGEAILTAEQSRVWRGMLNGPTNSNSALDYGALGDVIRENAPEAGGDVYLDKRIVGRVISAQQADSYRTYERSGYQG